jgi:hypothetical protein
MYVQVYRILERVIFGSRLIILEFFSKYPPSLTLSLPKFPEAGPQTAAFSMEKTYV